MMDPWTTPGELSTCSAPEDADLAGACQFATEVLHALSGQQYGLTTATVRPTRLNPGCGCDLHGLGGGSLGGDGWGGCGCVASSEIVFLQPVVSITKVTVGGEVLDPSAYRLYDNRRLVRLWAGGRALAWPCCQRLEMEPDQPGTFEITYQSGTPVPYGGVVAARLLACWAAKQIQPGANELPTRTVQTNRQGVSITVLDPQTFIKQRRTGIGAVDMWIMSVNPEKATSSPSVWSPDTIAMPHT